MKRSPELAELSRQHQHALSLAVRARRAAGLDADTLAELSQRCRREYETELAPHFAVEEDLLLPALQVAGEPELVERALAEHGEIRRLVQALAAPTPAVVAAFGDLLNDHVRFEERILFPAAERLLSPGVLAQVAAASAKG